MSKPEFKPDYVMPEACFHHDRHVQLTRKQAAIVQELLGIAHETDGPGKPQGSFLLRLADAIDKAANADMEAGQSNLVVVEVVAA